MNNEDLAKQLVASSYRQSAERIQMALSGRLNVRNSRRPQTPPVGSDEVVGLCGQGGRHPYFHIPRSALEHAIERILGVFTPTNISPEASDVGMEEIAAACQELRQQTTFDTGTGCTNDVLPAMVPLLPPEEIWLEDVELPLDVWRLLSFDTDLVSSAVSTQVAVGDFAFSSFSQDALIFRYLLGRLGDRKVAFEVELEKMPAGWFPASSQRITLDVSLARIFFEAGGLLTPMANTEFIKWYAAIRYVHWIDEAVTTLKVKDDFKEESVDTRYRGLFAEEMAIGLMAVVLNCLFGAKPILNTTEVAPPGTIRRGAPIADFVAQTTHPSFASTTTIIAESKGSLGQSVNLTRRKRAKVQVKSTNVAFPGTTDTLRLTFCSNVFFTGQAERTHCLVTDPPEEPAGRPTQIPPVQAFRTAYAKALKFVGMETASRQILRGVPAASLRPIDSDHPREQRRNEADEQRFRRAQIARYRFGVELLLDAGPAAIGIDGSILGILRAGINEDTVPKLSEALDDQLHRWRDHQGAKSFSSSLGIGCVFYTELDSDDLRGQQPDDDLTPMGL